MAQVQKDGLLYTDALLLRPASAEDFQYLRQTEQDMEVRAVHYDRPATDAEIEERLARYCSYDHADGNCAWLIFERVSGDFCGRIALESYKLHMIENVRTDPGTVEVGYAMAFPQWGKGIATAAVGAVADWAREHDALRYMVAVVLPENIGSQKVLKNNGFTYAGDRMVGQISRYYELAV